MWLGISFPAQGLIRHPDTCIPKRQNLQSSERDGRLAKLWRCSGGFGIRMENLIGHITIAADLRIKLGADDEFYQNATQKFLSYLRSTGNDGRQLATTHVLAPLLGIQGGVDLAEGN